MKAPLSLLINSILSLGIVVVGCLTSPSTSYGKPANICEEGLISDQASLELSAQILDLQKKASLALGYTPIFKEVASAGNSAGFIEVQLEHPIFRSTVLAKLSADLSENGQALESVLIEVLNENNYNKGLSNLIFGATLSRYPNISRISLDLAMDNLRIFKQGIDMGLSHEEAFKKTPAYKKYAHFGFKNITITQPSQFNFSVTVSK